MALEENKGNTKPSVLDQWRRRKKEAATPVGILPRPQDQAAVPSSGQQRLWLLQQLYPENPFYQYGHLYRIEGKLNIELLTQSFQKLLVDHEILRTNFIETEQGLVLNIPPSRDFECSQIDLREWPLEQRNTKAFQIAQREATQLFDLSKDLLFRVSLIQFSENSFWMVLSMHHIIGDRESLRILNDALFAHYRSLLNGKEVASEKPTIQYADYAFWQSQQKTPVQDRDYWLEQLSGDLPLLSLPSDFNRPVQPTFKGHSLSKKLSPALSTQIRTLAKSWNTTPYVFLLSAFKVLLYRYTGQTDLLVGSPFSNRDKVALENLIGFFNETLVLRSQIAKDLSFKDWVTQIKTISLQAFEHKNMPFEELVRTLQPERHGSANPIFQVMYLFNKVDADSLSDLEFTIHEETLDLGVSKFDLTLFVNDWNEYLDCTFEFASDLLKQDTVERMLLHLEILLQSVVDNPELKLAEIPILTPAEQQQILVDWNSTQEDLPEYTTIHQLIESMAQQHPNKIAVVDENTEQTYTQLDSDASTIAASLLASGVSTNSPVGLYIDRRVEMITGILAILKAGAAYLPLDPEYPEERLQHMLRDSGTTLILTSENLAKKLDFTEARMVIMEVALKNNIAQSLPLPSGDSDHLAYLIYTSGSTGLPKGVPIKHKNLLHSTLARFSFFPSKPESFLLLSSFSFDSSVAGIFWTLCSGGKLVLPPKRIEQDVALLGTLVAREEVTHTLMLPSLYSAILHHAPKEKLSTLKNVMVAGEACLFSLIEKHYELLPDTGLYNEYGPTEATVWCIAHQIRPDEKDFVPIGKAIPNTQAYILDEALQVVPMGVVGELYIGGLGLAEGYLNRPELTAERFVHPPFLNDPELKIYKTGDLARFHQDGLIEFLGRSDQQVKIRGFRVEPEEIQKVLMEHDLVQEALVIVHALSENKQENRLQLIAYISPAPGEALAGIRNFLKSKLPPYMVPAAIIPLEEFPRLPNGKINRKGLPLPDTFSTIAERQFVAPQTDLEIQLARIWETVLQVKPIGIKDNFFSIGGDSILSIQVVAKAREAGIFLAPNQLFEQQNIEELAQGIDSKEVLKKQTTPVNRLDRYPLSSLQKAFLFNSQPEQKDQGLLHLEFTIAGEIDLEDFQNSWQQSMQRHPAMRTYVQMEKGTPLQVIAPEAILPWTFSDWQNQTTQEQHKALEHLRQSEENKSLDLYTAPASRIHLIRLGDQKHLLFWTCHHIFLDGWSCGIILKDALTFYAAIQNGQAPKVSVAPGFPDYLEWKNQQDKQSAKAFWQRELKGFRKAQLLETKASDTFGAKNYTDDLLQLSEQETAALQKFCQQNQISLSTLFQGLWAMLIARLFQTNDVLYGLTVSGRFSAFEGIESTSGLLMNVVPNRCRLMPDQVLTDWLRILQKEQGQKVKYEDSRPEQIQSWIDWPKHRELYDSLFVYGNFLKDGLRVGPLEITHFQGGFSSAYPLTIRVNPLQRLEVNWRYDSHQISEEKITWIKKAFYELCQKVVSDQPKVLVQELLDSLTFHFASAKSIDVFEEKTMLNSTKANNDSLGVTDPVLLQLQQIWAGIFGRSNIGIEDNFFELGGKSLMAIQLFSEIEKEMDWVLPPATLFQHPTIAALAALAQKDQLSENSFSPLVPLRSGGSRPPLFCLHGGGAHVFFYRAFADYLSDDQPVYSLQPPGLDGRAAFFESIEQMAAHYIDLIKTVQAHGPYQILGTCFSNAVALEMAKQLDAQGESIALLLIIDSGPVHLFGDATDGKSKTWIRFYDMLRRGDFSRIRQKISRRFSRSNKNPKRTSQTESESERNLRLTIDSLNGLYAKYHWEAFDGKIHLIRSSEFHGRADKKYHISQWNRLAKGGLEIKVVDGHHLSLFEEPEVAGLAAMVETCMEAVLLNQNS